MPIFVRFLVALAICIGAIGESVSTGESTCLTISLAIAGGIMLGDAIYALVEVLRESGPC